MIAAGVGLAVIITRFRRTPTRPRRAEILDRRQFTALFKLNGDILIRSLVLNAAFALMTRLGSNQGAVTLAANAVLMNIFMLSAFFLDGLAGAAEQLSGRAVGAAYRHAFRRALILTGGWSLAISLLITLLFLMVGTPLIALMTTAPDVRTVAATYLPWAALTAISGAIAFQMDGVYIGATWSRDMRNRMLGAFGRLLPQFGIPGAAIRQSWTLGCVAHLPLHARRPSGSTATCQDAPDLRKRRFVIVRIFRRQAQMPRSPDEEKGRSKEDH